MKELEASQSALQSQVAVLEKAGSESKPEAETESTAMEASTPAEDAAPTPVAAAPEPVVAEVPEPIEADEKSAVAGMLNVRVSRIS